MPSRLELALPDCATLLSLTHALRAGWVAEPCPVHWVGERQAEEAADQVGLLTLAPALAAGRLADSHVVVADVAVVAHMRGVLALASDRRADALVAAEIDVSDASRTAETLLRILAVQHFGATDWQITRQPAPAAPARLIEGAAALTALAEAEVAERTTRAPLGPAPAETDDEADDRTNEDAAEATMTPHTTDLARAWYVLTGLPWVSHVLLAPRESFEAETAAVAAIVAALQVAGRMGREQESIIVAEVAARLGIPTAAVRHVLQARRGLLGVEEQRALATFLNRAARHGGQHDLGQPTIISIGGA